jgi:hypothetical protein
VSIYFQTYCGFVTKLGTAVCRNSLPRFNTRQVTQRENIQDAQTELCIIQRSIRCRDYQANNLVPGLWRIHCGYSVRSFQHGYPEKQGSLAGFPVSFPVHIQMPRSERLFGTDFNLQIWQ